MQFLTFEQANRIPFERQYRHSVVTASIALFIDAAIGVVSAYFIYLAWIQNQIGGVLIAGWITLWAFLFGLLFWGITKRRMLPSNWLVRIHATAISIKIRSYLNHHLDPHDAIVVQIPYSEIEYARAHRIRQDVPGSSRGDVETRFVRFAEFKLRDNDVLALLEEKVSVERARRAPMQGRFIRHRRKDGDYPVQMADGFLRVQWFVWPRLPRFMVDLSKHLPVKESVRTRQDFIGLKKATQREQEDALLRLMAAGDRFGAIRIIKEIYGYDITQAVAFLEDLSKPKQE